MDEGLRPGEAAVIGLNVLLLAFAIVSYFLLPDTVERHWRFSGEILHGDRLYVLSGPVISIAVSAASLITARLYRKARPVDGDTVYCAMLMCCLVVISVCYAAVGIILGRNL